MKITFDDGINRKTVTPLNESLKNREVYKGASLLKAISAWK